MNIQKVTEAIKTAIEEALHGCVSPGIIAEVTGFGEKLATALPAGMELVGKGFADLRVALPQEPTGSNVHTFDQALPLCQIDSTWAVKITPTAIAEILSKIHQNKRESDQLLYVADVLVTEATGFAKRQQR